MNFNPLDLPGPAFLAFYAFALIAAHFVGKALIRLCQARPVESSTLPDQLQPQEAAYLAGGTERAVDAALVRLLHADLIAVKSGGGGFEVKGQKPANLQLSELQNDVYREIGRKNGAIDVLHRLQSVFLTRTEVRLANDGLLLARGGAEATCVRSAKTLPFAAVIAIGVIKIVIGLSRHRPVVFLTVFVLVSLVILGVKFFNLPLRSARGEAALEKLKRKNAAVETTVRRRSRDVDDTSLLLAVALFGPQVLTTSGWAWMHEGFVNRQSSSSDSGGGSCSGGCGGGGCGGCGG